ncbi:hypothetical protein Tco_0201624 [Tanacetum coccineum]
MVPARTSLTGFSGETIWPLGQLRLLVTIGNADHYTKAWMNFMIVKSISPYNGIIGRPGIREIQAVPSTAHGMLKFPADRGIVTIRSTILIPAECAMVITSPKEIPKEAEPVIKTLKFNRLKHGTSPAVCYPLPEIDWKIESLCGYPFKCFLDAYKGYHQIQMAESYEEKTAFHTSQGVLVETWKCMSMTWSLKVLTEAKMLRDIGEVFRTLRKINMKLNPKKSTFGAVEGMFLGYTITLEGIKPYPDKTEAVLQLPSPWTIKEVQSLNGKLASLNRFLSKSAE